MMNSVQNTCGRSRDERGCSLPSAFGRVRHTCSGRKDIPMGEVCNHHLLRLSLHRRAFSLLPSPIYISLSNVYAIWKTLVATIIVFVGDRKGGRAILRHFPFYFMSLELVFITFECNVDSLMSLFIIFDFHPVCSSSNKHVQAAFRSHTRHRHQPLGQPILCQQPVCQQSPLLQETGMPSGTMMTRLWFYFGFAHRGAKGSHAKQIKFVL